MTSEVTFSKLGMNTMPVEAICHLLQGPEILNGTSSINMKFCSALLQNVNEAK
jgi:hypothetical protein